MNSNTYPITAQEKQFAIEHLTKTGKAFIDAISAMSERQWYLRPGPGQWSAAECAQHLLETELYFFMPSVDKMLADASQPEKMSETSGKDQSIIDSMEIRSHKIKGQPWEESSDKVIDKEALIKAFKAKREENILWLKNSDGNFRANFIDFPGMGALDVYQFILFISAHTTRHTAQIHEIPVLQEA